MTDPVPNWQDSPSTATPVDAANLNELSNAIIQIQGILTDEQVDLTVVGPVTTNYTASVNQYVLMNTTSGSWTVTFPTAPANASVVGVKQVIQGGSNTVTLQLGGSDTFNTTSGGQTGTIKLLNQAAMFQYVSASAVWVDISDDVPLSQLDLRYVNSVTNSDGSVAITGTSVAPVVSLPSATQSTIKPSYTAGGQWGVNVYGNQFENTERDDVAGTYLVLSGDRTVLVLLGW